jgi:phytoene dehydrogenase-like protein
MLDDETEFESNYVVSTIDAHQTFNNLIDPQFVPYEFKKRLDIPVSCSAFTVSIITDINPLEHGFNTADTYINSSFNPDDIYGFSGDPDKILIRLTFPTLIDPSVRAKGIDTGLHGIQIMAIAWFEYENFWKAGPELQRGTEYREFKKAYADKLIKRVEGHIPDFSKHITHLDISTPITYYRYTLNHYGASLGWEKPPSWKQKCPYIKGLYQAGHWTFPGPMLNGAIPSGKFAAELILKQD